MNENLNKQESILNDQLGGTLQTGKNTELFKIHEPREKENTIFKIIEKDGKFSIALGNQLCCEWTDDKEECEQMLEKRDWKLISMICLKTTEYYNA